MIAIGVPWLPPLPPLSLDSPQRNLCDRRRIGVRRSNSAVPTLRSNISLAMHYPSQLYHALFPFIPFPLSSFFFFPFPSFFFHRWYRCLLLGRVTNYSPRRRSKNLISNSPYLWSRRLNISLQTPLSVPLLHAVFSPPPIVFFPFSARNTMARATSGQKGGPVPCKVIRSDIRKFNRNYATERIQSKCRLAKNQ